MANINSVGSDKGDQPRLILATLTFVIGFAVLDRSIIAMLVEPVKEEFSLSDGQIGFLTGLAFAMAYAIFGIPLSRLADRVPRLNLMAAFITVWSIMTGLGAFTTSYIQLVLTRIGVGASEAGNVPTAHSLIADLFSPEKRPTAVAIYSFGGVLGGSLAFLAGGWLVENVGWRQTLIIAAAPGLILAVVLLFLREPARGMKDTKTEAEKRSKQSDLVSDLKILAASPVYVRTVIAFSLFGFVAYGIGYWLPSFLVRSMDFGMVKVGQFLSAAALFGGVVGTAFLAVISERLLKKNRSFYLWIAAGALFTLLFLAPFFFLWNHPWVIYLWFIVEIAVFITAPLIFAFVMDTARPDQRALASSVNIVCLSVVGMGLGPQTVGWISDMLQPVFAEQSLAYALCILCSAVIPCNVLLLMNVRTMRKTWDAKDSSSP
ncbi:MAG: MFS transporter [Pseudomonadota bacterium]